MDRIYRRTKEWLTHHGHEIRYEDIAEEIWLPKGPTEHESASDFKDMIAYWSDPYQGFSVRYGISGLPTINVMSVISFQNFTINKVVYKDYVFRPQCLNECMANAWIRNEFDMPINCPQYPSIHQMELFSDQFYEFFLNKWLPLINYWWMCSWSDADKFALLGGLMTLGVVKKRKKNGEVVNVMEPLAPGTKLAAEKTALPEPQPLIAWFPTMRTVMDYRMHTNGLPYPPYLIEKINILFSPDFQRLLNERLLGNRSFKEQAMRVQEKLLKRKAEKEAAAAAAAAAPPPPPLEPIPTLES